MADAIRAPSPYGPVVGSGRSVALVLLAALVSLVPVGIAGMGGSVAAHFALAPLYAATIKEDATIGPVGAFLAGLLVDVFTLAPLGVCAVAYLAFHAIASREAPVLSDLPVSARLVFFTPLALAVVAVHIVTMSVIDGSEPTRAEVVFSLVATLAAYPAMLMAGRMARGSVPRWRTRARTIKS